VKGGEVAVETVKGPDSKEQRIEHMNAIKSQVEEIIWSEIVYH
jgi:hypothetical protein